VGEKLGAAGTIDDAAFAETSPVGCTFACISGGVSGSDGDIEADGLSSDILQTQAGEGDSDFDCYLRSPVFPSFLGSTL